MKRILYLALLALAACSTSGDTEAPATPTDLVAMAGEASVVLRWTASPDADVKGYNVYWGTAADALAQRTFVARAPSSHTIGGLSNGTAYFFALDAEDASGNASARTAVVSATPGLSTPKWTVGFSSLTGTVHTNGELSIQVVVTGGTPDNVEILKDGTVLVGNLAAPYSYVWDTSAAAEGSYSLTARAGQDGSFFESQGSVTVVVDRSVPSILERTPAPGAENVRYSDPIVVTFTEPMLGSTLTAGGARLEMDNAPIPFAMSLAEDGLSLTVAPTPGHARAFDERVQLSILRGTDLAGNRLDSSWWEWWVPNWITVGGDRVSEVAESQLVSIAPDSLELDGSGHPVVVVNEIEQIGGDEGTLYVKRWTGTRWERLGEELADGDGTFVLRSALAIDASGHPVVAWGTTGVPVQVARWDGAMWLPVGSGGLNIDPARTAFPTSLTLDASGHPVLAIVEARNALRPFQYQLYVKRWTGSSWQLVGGGSVNQDAEHGVLSGSLALDGSGRPVVAWDEGDEETFEQRSVFVKRWTGTAWELVGGGDVNALPLAFGPSLVLDGSDRPILSFLERAGSADPGLVYVQAFDGTAWQNVASGSNPASDPTKNAYNASLALDSAGRPVLRYTVATTTAGRSDVHFKRLDGRNWHVLAELISVADANSLAVDELGNPFTAVTRMTTTPTVNMAAYVLEANH